jgi:hypothetical protein
VSLPPPNRRAVQIRQESGRPVDHQVIVLNGERGPAVLKGSGQLQRLSRGTANPPLSRTNGAPTRASETGALTGYHLRFVAVQPFLVVFIRYTATKAVVIGEIRFSIRYIDGRVAVGNCEFRPSLLGL